MRDLEEELDIHDDMIIALIELLEEKGVLKEEEWENLVEEKLSEAEELERL